MIETRASILDQPSVYDESAYSFMRGTAGPSGTQLWSVWLFIWRPLRGRWCLVLHGRKHWSDEEMAVDPVLAMSIRPYVFMFGPLYLAMDTAAKLPAPFVDTLSESPFWNGPRQ